MARKILALVALFLVFYLGAHFYIRWKNTVTDDVTKISRAVDCEPNDFLRLAIRQNIDGKKEEIRMERFDHPEAGTPAVVAVARWHWKITEPALGEADPVVVARLASTVCELYDPIPVRESEFHPETATRRLAQEFEATLRTPAGEKTLRFQFGAHLDRNTVVRFENEAGKVRFLRIPDRLLQFTSRAPEDYRNFRVMQLDADNVQRAHLEVAGKERFTLEREGGDWAVLAGGKRKGMGSEEANRFVNRVATLRGLKVLEENFPAEKCAAMPARVVVRMKGVAAKEEELRFNYQPKSDHLEGCSTLGNQLFFVHHDLVQYVEIPIQAVLGAPTANFVK